MRGESEMQTGRVATDPLARFWDNDEERVLARVVQIAAELTREKPAYNEAIIEFVARINAVFAWPTTMPK